MIDFMPARRYSAMFEVPAASDLVTPESKLEVIHSRLKDMVLNRMLAMVEESQTIASDMDALRLRVKTLGQRAKIEDIRSARWYRTRDQLVLARDMYRFVCGVLGVEEGEILANCECTDTVQSDVDG